MSDERVEQEEQREGQEVDDRLLRLAADFDNYKKRAARERQEYVAFANERLLKELLPILDDLERALDAAEQHEEAQLEDGVRLVYRSLASLLERHGVQQIPTDGKFDPHVHEALQQASQKLAEAVYAQATAQAQSTGATTTNGGTDDEVVEDADYEVIDEEAKTSS